MSRTDKDTPYWVRALHDEHDLDIQWRSRWFAPPSRSVRHIRYFGPERAHVRLTLHDVARDHRANADDDWYPERETIDRRTRSSLWVGGYWD